MNLPTDANSCDVLVIGGGPAGSTAAALLSEQGWRVTLLEKDQHPRFHIGESLLPMNLPLFERLGVLDQVKALGVRKHGAEFGSAHYPEKRSTYFRDALNREYPYAFQVRRSEFDHLLLNNSVERGVTVHQGMTVKDVEFQPDVVIAHAVDEQGQDSTWQARFVVDGSGRDTLLARKQGLKQKNPKHQSAAVFGHFRHVERLAGDDAGNTSVYWFEHGWFWLIPLRDGVMSVGAVCWPDYLKTRDNRRLEDFLWDTIALCPDAQTRMREAELCSPVQATGNYSYRATRMVGDRYVLVGDAFAFIDPVFSTGVLLAMQSAALASEAVDAWLREPNAAATTACFRRFERYVRRSTRTVSWFIYRFTSPALHHLFMNPRDVWGIPQAIVSMLAGDFNNRRAWLPLTFFKGIYWLTWLGRGSASWAAYRLRRRGAVQ